MSNEPTSEKGDDSFDAQIAEYNATMEYRKGLNEALVTVSGRFTQWSMGLTGGALALSLTYLEKLEPDHGKGIGLLIACWASLTLGIICGLVSLYMSEKSVHAQIANLDRLCEAKNRDPNGLFALESNGASGWTRHLAKVNIFLFIIGVALFLCFVWICPPGNKPEIEDHVPKHPATTTTTSTAATAPTSS